MKYVAITIIIDCKIIKPRKRLNQPYYLIAFALVEQSGKRAMPIGGKSIKESESNKALPKELAELLALEILLRVFAKTDQNQTKRIAKEKSILLAKISMNRMQEDLPSLKSEWISEGNTQILINKLMGICEGLWNVDYTKYEGVKIESINNQNLRAN